MVGGLLVGLALFVGCTHVIERPTPYYEDGPTQLAPPQGTFEAGTRVLLLGREGSYANVWSWSGKRGYVWEGALGSIWAARSNAEQRRKSEDADPRGKEFDRDTPGAYVE